MGNNRCLCCGEISNEGIWHQRCIQSFFHTHELPYIELDKNNLETLALTQLGQRKGVAGVQEKLSLHLELEKRQRPRLTLVGFPSGYILKPQSSTYKQLPEFEQTAMLLADLCHIKTVPHALIPINDNEELAYITRRIDRVGESKIHMEDFCQASNLVTSLKYRSSYEHCAELIRKHSKYPLLDITNFFTMLYFGFVIGNSDMHLKNFSFLMDEEGKLELSPACDILPTKVILKSDHDDLGLTMNGVKTNLRAHDFEAYCKAVGIDSKQKRNIMSSIDSKYAQMVEIINSSSLHQDGKSSWIKLIASNIKRAQKS